MLPRDEPKRWPAAGHTAENGTQPHTKVHELVHCLPHLKDQAA